MTATENFRDFYEFEAGVYPTTLEQEPAARHRLRLVESLLPPERGGAALDVGCGDGVLCKELRKKGYKRVAGLDLAFRRVRFAKTLFPAALYAEGEIYALPFRDSSFHLVTCADLLEHTLEPQQAMNELLRVAKGYLILTVPYSIKPEKTLCPHCKKEFYLYGHIQNLTKERLEEMAQRAGGRVVRSKHRIPLFECRRYKYLPFLKWILRAHFKETGTLGVLIKKG